MRPRLPHRPIAISALIFTVVACSRGEEVSKVPSNPATEKYAAALNVNLPQSIRKSDDLYIQDVVVGTGDEAIAGKRLGMTYTGWLVNGSKFDSNVGRGPFTFTLGQHQVIDGWDQGVAGMKVGGKRRIIIGSGLGYGPAGSPPVIPPNSTLVFDVELLTVK